MFRKSSFLAPLFLVGALAVATVVPASTAQAQPVVDAASRFAQAQSLYDAGNFTGALPIFEELTRETSSPNARFYVARCLRELGRTVEAYDAMVATVRDGGTDLYRAALARPLALAIGNEGAGLAPALIAAFFSRSSATKRSLSLASGSSRMLRSCWR